MSKNYNPVIVHYSANTLLQSSENTKYVKVFGYVESNQDVAWFNSKQYKEDGLFGTKRSLDKNNKLLAIVRLEYKGRKIRRRYQTDNTLNLTNNQVGLTSESARILFDDIPDVSNEVITISKGNIWDTIMFYWNHPFHATRISFKVGFPSLIIGIAALIIGIIGILK
ncbi:MAG: hypothetical protein IJN30_05200 [Bacteroidales bacterium]|nr:hypothetical protein [Bacteroidales bacterium]